MAIWNLGERSNGSYRAMTDYDKILLEAKPAWETDGGGIRGNPIRTFFNTGTYGFPQATVTQSRIDVDSGGPVVWDSVEGVGGGSPPPASYHPFKVLVKNTGTDTSPNWVAGVYYKSSLFKSLRPNDKMTITGLLNEAQTSGWFALNSNDAIWLGITFDNNGTPNWAGIDSWGQGDSFEIDEEAWSGDDSYCEDNGETTGPNAYKHQTSRKLIAYTVAGDDGNPVLHQVMFHDQLLRNVCIDGRPARYPFDHEGGYPL
jgi:hypothetical protein